MVFAGGLAVGELDVGGVADHVDGCSVLWAMGC